MNVFEKIREKLEEEKMKHFLTIANTGDDKLDFAYEKVGDALDGAIKIVNQVEEEYNNGWIPCGERLPEEPEEDLQDIRYFPEYNVTIVGAEESTTLYYMGDGEWSDVDGNAYSVIAWQPLPEPYKPEGE